MKFNVREWPLLYLYKIRNKINFPVYQRGLVWDEEKKRLLVDSIFRGIDIPKLYMQKIADEEWDCIDGHQRIQAIIGFFDREFEYQRQTFEELTQEEKQTFEEYKLTITEVDEITEDEVRLLFTRLQLGVPLNAGEKLNAIRSNMGEFVKRMKEHVFIRNISIPTRRFAKEQVCAQICNNSSFVNRTGGFRNSKYEDLENLYRAYVDFDLASPEARGIMGILERLHGIFGDQATEITNRASAVSIYLIVEELVNNNELGGKEVAVKDFYIRFLSNVREEARLGIDATSRFLLSYQSRILQAADSKSSVTTRHDTLRLALQHYLETEEIMR